VTYTFNGLGNQLASLQLLAGLAASMPEQKISAIYCKATTGQKWAIQDPQQYQVDTSAWDEEFFDHSSPTLLDMLDYSFPENVVFYNDDRIIKNRTNSNIINCQSQVVASPGTSPEELQEFTIGHKSLAQLYPDKNNIFTLALSWYSSFFVNRPLAVDRELAKIKFNSEYLEFVSRIKQDVGPFTGAHVRIMRDHHHVYKFAESAYLEGIESVSSSNKPLLLSVDDWNHELVTKNASKYVQVHELILKEYGKDFKSLSHHNRVDLATLSMLLMIDSDEFIGTYGSTYTAYIQQQRAQRGVEDWKFFTGTMHDSYDKTKKPYSWHSSDYGPIISWERDWEECRLRYDQF
jgi:hypothetical protein